MFFVVVKQEVSMGVYQNIQDLLGYIELNNQKSYAKVKQDLQALQNELKNTAPSSMQIIRYHAAIKMLVSNYFSTEYPSPLMYFSANSQIDLVKDLLACPDTQVNEVFNHKITKTQTNWFGSVTDIKVNGPQHGYTALLFAALAEKPEIVKLLIKHYAHSQHKINDQEVLLDRLSNDQFFEMKLLLTNARFEQIHYLSMDLSVCENKEQLTRLINIQQYLGISKAEILACILEIYPNDHEKAIAVFDQAADINEYSVPQNCLAEYVMTSDSLLGGVDVEAMAKIDAKRAKLSQNKPLIKPFLTVYLQATGKTLEIAGPMKVYGPQTHESTALEVLRGYHRL
jgi:hypothetical protein